MKEAITTYHVPERHLGHAKEKFFFLDVGKALKHVLQGKLQLRGSKMVDHNPLDTGRLRTTTGRGIAEVELEHGGARYCSPAELSTTVIIITELQHHLLLHGYRFLLQ